MVAPTEASVQQAMTDFQTRLNDNPHLTAVIVNSPNPLAWWVPSPQNTNDLIWHYLLFL